MNSRRLSSSPKPDHLRRISRSACGRCSRPCGRTLVHSTRSTSVTPHFYWMWPICHRPHSAVKVKFTLIGLGDLMLFVRGTLLRLDRLADAVRGTTMSSTILICGAVDVVALVTDSCSRPWLAMGSRRHEGLALLDGGALARTRVGNPAGVRPRFREAAPEAY